MRKVRYEAQVVEYLLFRLKSLDALELRQLLSVDDPDYVNALLSMARAERALKSQR